MSVAWCQPIGLMHVVGWEGGVVVSSALTGAKCFNRSQNRSRIVALKEIVVAVNADKTECMFVSCGQNAVQDNSTKFGDKSVDSVPLCKYLGTDMANRYCIDEISTG